MRPRASGRMTRIRVGTRPPACLLRICRVWVAGLRVEEQGRARAGAPRRTRRVRAARAGKEDAEDDAERPDAGKYAKFYAEFGKAVKLGIIEDPPNRNRLAKLLRFHTSKSGDKMIGLDEYMSRMQPDQKQIYYLSGARARPPLPPCLRAQFAPAGLGHARALV